jgi:cytochrome c biogenesis protein
MGTTNFLRPFSSVKLTIFLLILLILASILGTLIPQDWSEMQYKEKYGETYGLLKTLQLTDVYHSYWYSVLLTVFCAHLIICSTMNFGPLVKSLKRSSSVAERVEITSLPFNEKIAIKQSNRTGEEIAQSIKNTLSRSFYRLKYTDAERGIHYFERGKISRLGPLITHSSILIILIGGIIVGRLGFIEHRNITVGKTIDVPRSNFQVRADDFMVEFYPNGMPKEYASVLTIIENGTPKHTETIKVNHPLKYKGIKFFQSSYGIADTAEIELSKKSLDKSSVEVLGKFRISPEEEMQVPNTQLKLKVKNIVPDFVRDESGQIGTRSMEPRNPAALIELYDGNELKESSWVFLKYPDFHASGNSEYSLKFTSTVYYTGLQISSDPGIFVIWAGCLIMIIGMSLSFYLSYKRVWIKISADTIEIGGRSYKDRTGFEKEFEHVKMGL